VTRRERHEQVRKLKEAGLTFKEITAHLGLSKSTVTDAYYDPTGDASRERKSRRKSNCVDCGAVVTNSGSEPPKRCLACHNLRNGDLDARRAQSRDPRRCARRWTRERIIAALLSVAVDGRLTTGMYAQAYEQASRGSLPSKAIIARSFDKWTDALDAAGLVGAGWRVDRERLTRESCLLAIEDCAIDTGHPPSYREYQVWARGTGAPSGEIIRVRWGRWMAVIEALVARTDKEPHRVAA
jgi:hypothetical protein